MSSAAAEAERKSPGGTTSGRERILRRAQRSREHQRREEQRRERMEGLEPVVNSLGMKLVPIPAGEYRMGTTEEEREALRKEYEGQEQLPWVSLWLAHLDNEGPAHGVRFRKPFHMGATEVTVGQWEDFVRSTGYLTEAERSAETGVQAFGLDLRTGQVEPRPWYNWRFWLRESAERPSGFLPTSEHPVVCVSWNDAVAFCEWLSEREGRTYRLPTEAEWEYACRAGSDLAYGTGDTIAELRKTANVADKTLQGRWKLRFPGAPEPMDAPPYAVGWSDEHPFLAPVASFEPNPWGLYDMQGNGGEWCLDWYAPYGELVDSDEVLEDPVYDPAEPPKVDVSAVIPGADPMPLRVIRGGVWLDPPFGFRCTGRETHRRHPVQAAADIGFRVVLSEEPPVRLPPTRGRVVKAAEGKPLDEDGNFFAASESADNDGAAFVFEAHLPGDHPGVPLHLHEEEVEIVRVLAGEFIFEMGDPAAPRDRSRDQRLHLTEGDTATFPVRTPHGFRNARTDPTDRASALIIVVPAGLEALYAEAQGLPPEEFVRLGMEKYGMVTLAGPPALDEVETGGGGAEREDAVEDASAGKEGRSSDASKGG